MNKHYSKYQMKYIESHTWYRPFLAARYRARRKGLEFNLAREDYVVPAFCPILGIPITKGKGRATPNSPSLDRIDNSKGYVKGNVQVISVMANTMKSNADPKQIMKLATYMNPIQITISNFHLVANTGELQC